MIQVAVGIIIRDGRALLCQRKRTARYPLQWEFPGGKVEEGESIEACLRRELSEELAIEPGVGEFYYCGKYNYPDSGEFEVHYHLVHSFAGEIRNNNFETLAWPLIGDLASFNILEGNRDVVRKLMEEYGEPG